MKSFFIFLSRNKLYTFINFFGLSVSLAVIFIIAGYTTNQLQTDSFQENADRIYVLSSGDRKAHAAYGISPMLADNFPEVEHAVALHCESFQTKINDTESYRTVLIAAPAIYLIMRRWLENYNYRIGQPAWLYVATASFAGLVAFCTVVWFAVKTTRENPVTVLKKE